MYNPPPKKKKQKKKPLKGSLLIANFYSVAFIYFGAKVSITTHKTYFQLHALLEGFFLNQLLTFTKVMLYVFAQLLFQVFFQYEKIAKSVCSQFI